MNKTWWPKKALAILVIAFLVTFAVTTCQAEPTTPTATVNSDPSEQIMRQQIIQVTLQRLSKPYTGFTTSKPRFSCEELLKDKPIQASTWMPGEFDNTYQPPPVPPQVKLWFGRLQVKNPDKHMVVIDGYDMNGDWWFTQVIQPGSKVTIDFIYSGVRAWCFKYASWQKHTVDTKTYYGIGVPNTMYLSPLIPWIK